MARSHTRRALSSAEFLCRRLSELGNDMAKGTLFILLFALAAADLRAADRQPFTSAQICKAAIGVVMGRNPATMKVDKSIGNVTYISYVRPDDRKRWAYKCKLDGNRVLWGADDGRWRD